MKKSIPLVLVLLLGSMTLSAQSTIIKSGKCTIQEADAFDDTKLCILEASNKDIQVVYSIRGSEFFGKFVVITSPKITNLSGKPKHVDYSLAFFDKRGNLVASTSGITDLKKDTKDMQTGAAMPGVPKSILGKITSYQTAIYISAGKDE